MPSRAGSEDAAANACQLWQNTLTRLKALRDSVGTAAAEVHRQVADTEAQLTEISARLRAGRKQAEALSYEAGTARSEAKEAETTAAPPRGGRA